MFPVISARSVGPDVTRLDIAAPDLARAARPGQFLMLRIDERGERIPLTIADSDPEAGTVTVIFLAVGKSTQQLGRLKAGDSILDVAGPLGHHMEIERVGTVVCVGGGVGVPALYPKAKALKQAGNRVVSILGARSADLLVLVEEMTAVSDEVRITTDDGSRGRKGFVSDELADMLRDSGLPGARSRRPGDVPAPSGARDPIDRVRDSGLPREGPPDRGAIDLVVAVGPIPMMAAVAETTRPYNVKTLVSLNPIMVDGTGMCGGCRVTVAGETKFACVDGPVFDGHAVDFRELAQRQRRFERVERRAKEAYEHACRLR